MTRDHHGGFSLVELLIAMAVMVAFSGSLLSLVLAGQSMARMQPEAADVQQRARIGLQTLAAEFGLAGAGPDRGASAGPLVQSFPPIEPSADGGVTLWYVSGRDGQTRLALALAPGESSAAVEDSGGFAPASTAIVFDGHGCRDLLRVDAVAPMSLAVRAGSRGCVYAAGSAVAAGEVRTYRVDAGTRQLVRRDEATGSTVPVLDNVTSMTVAYLDEARHLRITLRFASAAASPLVPDLAFSFDVTPPNLQLR